MKSTLTYTGVRVRDLDAAIDFFTRVMGMKLVGRHASEWTKGEFANLRSGDDRQWLELNWYPEGGPVEGPFREGDVLDHLGFEVEDLAAALALLAKEGYAAKYGPFHGGGWHFAFVPVVDGLWLDVFHRDPSRPKRKAGARKAPRSRTRRRRPSG